MAITVRIGNEQDFKPGKLLPGEPAASLNAPKFRIGIGNGKYLELATIQELQDILDASQEEYENFKEFIEYLRENPNAYNAVIAQLDALPGKYVQLTNLTKLTKEGLRMEDFSPGNYFALGEVANSLEDKPEGVQLAQAFVTMYWDYGTTGNTTKRIELLERVNGRKWFKSYNGTTWGSWFEYARKTDVEPYTKLKEYTTWTDLGLTEAASLQEIFSRMASPSQAVLQLTKNNAGEEYPASFGLLLITKESDYRSDLELNCHTTTEAKTRKWVGSYHSTRGFSGWKELSFEGHNHNGFEPIDVTGKTLDIHSLTSQTPGIEWYRCRTSAGAANITNIPVAGQPFFLEKKVIRVGSANGTDLVINFRFLSSSAKKEYECWCTVSSTGTATWTEWKERP